ncbi:hypothetical protein [Natroniella sp. ANB-PHB2]|uniref:hypothetical protein n=1 Tax=Natroniella sp. ANB-PHB2 TaxID=3384444 RepID=UPI0038D418C6
MKRIIGLVVILLILVFVVVGCAENPRGTFGPAWDVPIRIPLVEHEREDIRGLLDDKDVKFGENDEVVEYHYSDLLEEVDLGDQLDQVADQLPQVEDDVSIGAIEVPGLGEVAALERLKIYGGVENEELESQKIEFDNFDKMVFSDDNDNEMKVKLTNHGEDLEEGEITLTFSSDETKIGDSVTIDVAGGGEEVWDLSGQTLPNEIDVDIKVDTSEESGEKSDEIDIAFVFENDLEVEEVENLELRDDFKENEAQIMKIDGFEAGLEEVKFKAGYLDLNVTGLENTGLEIDVTKFELDGTSAGDDDRIDLEDKILDLTEEIEVVVEVDVLADGDTITYNKDDHGQIDIKAGFNEVEFKYVKVDLDNFGLEDLEREVESDTFADLPEELADIEFSDELKLELIFEGLNDLGLGIELDDFEITVYYGENEDEDKDSLNLSEEIEGDKISLAGLIDLVIGKEVEKIKYGGNYSLGQTGDSVKIESDSQIDFKFNAEVPIEINLKEEIKHKLEPEALEDNLSEDDLELIEQGIKDARLKAEVDNELPIGVEIKIYVASISDYTIDEELEDELYQLENKLATKFDLEARSNNEDFEILFDVADADTFTKDNLYVGAKIILPDEKMELRSNDYIEINNLYAVLTAKVK